MEMFPQTGYFDESPFLTIDIDVEGTILGVAFALDAEDGRLDKDIQCTIDRFYEDDSMIWEMTFPQGSLMSCHKEETWHAAGKLADTLSATLTPHDGMLTLSLRSGKLGTRH